MIRPAREILKDLVEKFFWRCSDNGELYFKFIEDTSIREMEPELSAELEEFLNRHGLGKDDKNT